MQNTMQHPTTSTTSLPEGATLWLRKQVIGLVIIGALLFVAAGRLDWLGGWLMLVIFGVGIVGQFFAVDPDLLAERAKLQAGTKKWDIALAGLAASLLPMIAFVIGGLEFRNGGNAMTLTNLVVGVLGSVIGWAIILWAMVANRYFSATVRLQTDREQTVITTGPYAFVRHPGYVGAILYTLAIPLVLGSVYAYLPCLLAAVLYIVRTALEDRTLAKELPGYEAYKHDVHARLIPGIW